MFEDKNMLKFVCVALGFASIIIPGPIIPIVSLIVAIGLLVYKIKRAKESPEGFEALMIDIILIIIVVVVDIGFFAMRISVDNTYNKYNSSSNREEMTISELAETIITSYKMENLDQFSEDKNHLKAIRSGFTNFLKDELEIQEVSVNGNKITCNLDTDTIIFVVTKNDIKYSIK